MQTFDPEPKVSDNNINQFFEEAHHNISPIPFLTTKSIIVRDNVLSPEECDSVKRFIDNYTNCKIVGTKKKIIGNCSWLSKLVFSRCSSFIPKSVYIENSLLKSKIKDRRDDYFYWNSPSINNCWRMVRCSPGSSLSSHLDGRYVKSVDHTSIYTIMIYLSNNTDGELVFKDKTSIQPKPGRLVIFDQSLLHHGALNTESKYFIRSEIMYTRSKPIQSQNDIDAFRLYSEAISHHILNPSLALSLEQQAFTLSPLLESEILGPL